jgi:4-hydroxy-L-threonine phosphate dehydrogenase PdxA
MNGIFGKRVMIMGKHPHSGETGTIDRAETTNAGPGLIIKLDNCQHGTNECFVFKPENIAFIK